MSSAKILLVGCVAVLAAGVIGLVFWSLGAFALACVALGALIELCAVLALQSRSLPRVPVEDYDVMRATHSGKALAYADAPLSRSPRLLLVGLPALAVGAAIYLIVALIDSQGW
jgi:hypothetical protein